MDYSEEDNLSNLIVDCATKIHNELGPGLFESAYLECLIYELTKAGVVLETEKVVPIFYKGENLDIDCRVELLVGNKVVVAVKSVEELTYEHNAEVWTCMRFGNYKLGLILNFYVTKMEDGIKRIVN